MIYGKNVRSPQLLAGNRYAMKTWGKTPVYDEVLFVHFLRANNQTFKQPSVQLKDMLASDYYVFKCTDGSELRGKMKDLCLVRADTETRITFAELLQQTTALNTAPVAPVEPVVEETVAEEPVAEEAVEAVAEASDEGVVAETEAATTVKAVAPEGETSIERKRRLDRERKAEKRRLAKEALTALVMPVSDAAQAVT